MDTKEEATRLLREAKEDLDRAIRYSGAEVEKIFQKILRKAEEHGIVYDDQEKVFSLKTPKRVVFSLEE